MATSKLLTICLSLIAVVTAQAQEVKPGTIPTAVQWTINAAGRAQQTVIHSVFMLYCPKSGMKGTGFLLSNGLIVTNYHVVEGCTKDEMLADPWSKSAQFGFTKMVVDTIRDLALLRPAKKLQGGLELAATDNQPRT